MNYTLRHNQFVDINFNGVRRHQPDQKEDQGGDEPDGEDSARELANQEIGRDSFDPRTDGRRFGNSFCGHSYGAQRLLLFTGFSRLYVQLVRTICFGKLC